MFWRFTLVSIIKVLLGTSNLVSKAKNKVDGDYQNLDEVESEINQLNIQLARLLPILNAANEQPKKENPLDFKDVFEFEIK
jgi:hypothetical protein